MKGTIQGCPGALDIVKLLCFYSQFDSLTGVSGMPSKRSSRRTQKKVGPLDLGPLRVFFLNLQGLQKKETEFTYMQIDNII